MISNEVSELFKANVAGMTASDAPRLAQQVLPDGIERVKDVAYLLDGDEGHLLDIYRPDGSQDKPLPVIVDLHGGGLYYGTKENNECRDMMLAGEGFAVVNANFRLVPAVSFPDQIADAMVVLRWVWAQGETRNLDLNNVFVTGDSAGAALAFYVCAAVGSPQLAGAFGVERPDLTVRALAATSGMFRLQGGVHATALSYYMQGYLQTPGDHIRMDRYLDLDQVVVDGDLPPMYMVTSVEDFIADNTYEVARILQARHQDYALRVWPRGHDRVLGHIFNITLAGDPAAHEARETIHEIAGFFRSYMAPAR
ncbi:alpha/beta hydrolase [Bifidobacterium mongoliense]|uniref:alpha/beta hydrolase n=1 Tax=Bifidobacterium mongoliense TaxID=518643 RepID=UPI0030EEE338